MPRVAVVGAGSIGAWVGARLHAAGIPVNLIGRPRLAEVAMARGVTASLLSGEQDAFGPGELSVALTPEAVKDAAVVLVCVKGRDTSGAARQIRPHLAPDAVVVSLQNGLRNPDRLREALPEHRVVPGLVSFNVVWDSDEQGRARFRQATSGPIVLEAGGASALVAGLRSAGVAVAERPDMAGVQWAKLVLNLNNAVNALSGLPLREELLRRGYRRVLAAAMLEALAAADAAGQALVPVGRMRPRLAPRILPLPTPVFRLLAAPLIRIDPAARSSMADDLGRGRPTEIDDINGEVVRLAERVQTPAPVNRWLVQRVRAAEAAGTPPALPPEALWPTTPG